MKRPKLQTPKRPLMASTAVARSSKDAAIHLVRLEFDAARLNMGVAQAENRVLTYREELERNQAQRSKLLSMLRNYSVTR